MTPFDRHALSALMASHAGPCVSLYMPLHGKPPGSQQDPVHYANLVRQVRETLASRPNSKRDEAMTTTLERLEALGSGPEGDVGANGYGFWNRQRHGLAVFASPDYFAWYQVSIPLQELKVVADSFHVKPLLRILADDVRFHVLALGRDEVKLYEGNADHVAEVRVEGLPRNMKEAVGTEFDDSKVGRTFHGSPDHHKGRGSGAAGTHFHGYGGNEKSVDIDMLHFFREVDRVVTERVSQPTRLPLILCALGDHHPLYRQVSHDPFLLPEGIRHAPKGMTPEQLRAAAWGIFEPLRSHRIAQALDAFGAACGRDLAASDIVDVAHAAVQGRIGRLLLEDGRQEWGSLDRGTGSVTLGAQAGADHASDVLDDLAEVVLAFGGEVLLLPKDRMPVTTGVAATYRF